jgi:hypothetical protein
MLPSSDDARVAVMLRFECRNESATYSGSAGLFVTNGAVQIHEDDAIAKTEASAAPD